MKNWFTGLAHLRQGALWPAVQTAFYLLLTTGLVFAMMTLAACDCNDNGIDDCNVEEEAKYEARLQSLYSKIRGKSEPQAKPKIQSSQAIQMTNSGDVLHILNMDTPDTTTPITYTWYPPAGATNFTFPSRQPEAGGPPFIFRNVPATDPAVPVGYTPPTSGAYGGNRLPELLTAQQGADPPTTAYFLNTVGQANAMQEVKSAVSASAPQATVEMWDIERWHTREGITVTSATCQQAVDLLQSDAAFLALQVPEPPHPAGESALLPIYTAPTIELSDYDGGLDVAGKGGFRPTRFTFVANALPTKAGHIWMALGAQQTPTLTCPAGQQSINWEVHTALTLDLSYTANLCQGCILDLYLCYEGQTLPGNAVQRFVMEQAFNRALSQMAESSAGAAVQNYRDWGITCAGPLPLQLINDPTWSNWKLVGGSAQWITPTWSITLPHMLEGGTFDPPTQIDLTYNAPIGTNWHWSDGVHTITPPISFPGGYPPTNVYLVGAIPANTPAGLYTVQITATQVTSPTDYRRSSDLIWVGEWSPPPTGSVPRKYIYLPLVLRNKAAP